MPFSRAYLDELRRRVRLSDWIGREVRLQRHGREYVGRCPFHADRTPSFFVRDDKGFFHCFGCGAHGDAIEFISRIDRLDFGAAVRKLAGELAAGLPVAVHARPDRIIDRPDGDQAERRERSAGPRRMWDPRGTKVEIYLGTRELSLPPAPVLRWLPYCWNRETGREMPAMLARVDGPDGEFAALHRTWLLADGRGKAALREQKKSWGPIRGGAVRLAPAAPALAIAEGIENALTAIAGGYAAWSAVAAGGFQSVVLPPIVETVLVVADHDANGTGERAARKDADRWRAEGRRVRLWLARRAGDDLNDILIRGEGGEGERRAQEGKRGRGGSADAG